MYLSYQFKVKLLLFEKHIGTRVAIKHELTLTIAPQGYKGQSRACTRVKPQPAIVHAVFFQNIRQHVTKLIFSNLFNGVGLNISKVRSPFFLSIFLATSSIQDFNNMLAIVLSVPDIGGTSMHSNTVLWYQ